MTTAGATSEPGTERAPRQPTLTEAVLSVVVLIALIATTIVLFGTAATDGWAAGVGGRALRTRDGGLTWTPIETSTPRDLNDIAAHSSDNLWITGVGGLLRQMN